MMDDYMFSILALMFVAIAGAFDGAQTIRKDCGIETPLWRWMRTEKLRDWYMGGNDKYNPSFPSIPFIGLYQADFWHTMKFGWIYSWSIALALASMASFEIWHSVIFGLIAQAVEGQSFRIFYGNIFRSGKTDSIWKILFDFNPFKNTH